MRAGLERVGRFDPDGRRMRMRAGFDPATTHLIAVHGAAAGSLALAN
jgi:hypothetical protein